MRKLFAILFGIAVIFAISLIISLIPIEKIGNIMTKYSQKNNIKITTASSWNFRIFGFQATTNSLTLQTKIEKNQTEIKGKSENFVYSFITNNISCDSLELNIYLKHISEIDEFIKEVNNILSKKTYSIKIKNLTITIYRKDDNDNDTIYDEIMFQDVELTNKKNKITYSAGININTKKILNVFASTDNLGTDLYEVNAKIESENISCYLYDNKNSGIFNCSIKNLLELIKDMDISIEDDFYKKLLNKKIAVKADILHENNNVIIKGKTNINNDNGLFEYNSNNNLLTTTFENLNFDSLTDDIVFEEDDIQDKKEIKKNKEIMAMSGKRNTIINKVQKEKKKNDINYLHKVMIILLNLSNNISINNKIHIPKGMFNGIPIKNFNIDVSKKTHDNQFVINEITMDYNIPKDKPYIQASLEEQTDRNTEQQETQKQIINNTLEEYDKIQVKYEQNKLGNILIVGKNVDGLIKLFNIKQLQPSLQSNKYFVVGDVKLYTDGIVLSPITLIVDNKQIFQYESSASYDFENKNIVKNEIIKINDIKIEDYFNLHILYKQLYREFAEFQENDKQDAVFWKKLFDKHNNKIAPIEQKTIFSISNSTYYNERINNLTFSLEEKKAYTKVDIFSNSTFANGTLSADIRQQNEKETINTNLNTDVINLKSFETIFKDFELATNHNFQNVFFDNQNYNIPSFIGLHGAVNVKIDNLILNKTLNTHNIIGSFTLKDGVFESKNTQFKYGNGDIFANITLSLQNTPDLQIGLAASGINIDYILDTPLDGYVSNQCKLTARGFNPYLFIHDMKGKCTMIVQNLYIPKFDLLNTSNYIITNGIKKGFNYGQMIGKNSMAFSQGKGELVLESGILKGDIAFARELVSGSAEFEYSFDTNLINKLAGSFVMMVAREKLETPFPIYLPVACNGKPADPECLINWQQLEEVINSVEK